jgi:formylglycine-generating enzyme required for sulfatase activity
MGRRAAIGLALAGLGALVGCGEQDLYRPPESPFAVAGRLAMPSETQDVAVLGHYAYVAAGQSGLHVVDIQDPANPRSVLWTDTPKFAKSIALTRSYEPDGGVRQLALVVEGTEGIMSFDATGVPDTLIDLKESVGTTAYDAQAICVAPSEVLTDPYEVYLADTWRAVTGFVSSPGNPGQLSQNARVVPLGYSKDVAMSRDNTHVFVADDEMGVTVVDATEVYEMRLSVSGNADTPGHAQGIDVEGDFIYVADGEQGLQILRADAAYQPTRIASVDLGGDCLAIDVRDGTAFLAAKDAGLHVVDVRDPYHPVLLGSVVTSYAQGVAAGEDNLVCIADRDEGLLVFRGPALPVDIVAPGAVADLGARLPDTLLTSVELSWTAPGDDGAQGTAALYRLYRAPVPFADSTLELATEVPRRPRPAAAGATQGVLVTGLTPGAAQYFALRAEDEARNVSPLSSPLRVNLTMPRLTGGTVAPDSGGATTLFTYSVTYRDPEGDPPVLRVVVIDGQEHEMTPEPGGDFVTGQTYVYSTLLAVGSHDFTFAFDDGHGPRVQTRTQLDRPAVLPPFGIDLLAIEPGAFVMGSPPSEIGRDADEAQHSVTLTRRLEMSRIEINQTVYAGVMGHNPSGIPGGSRPVESVTFYDALRFCNAYSDLRGYARVYTLTGEVFDGPHVVDATVTWNREADGYRLPTEAEWEYACRAGAATSLSNGELAQERCEPDALLDAIGWYCGNADTGTGPRTHDGGRKAPNAFGLHDLHGNVWEWCWDAYAEYPPTEVTDPAGPDAEPWMQRVRRGGSWYYYARDCRSASRDAYWPGSRDNTLGFRIARNLD